MLLSLRKAVFQGPPQEVGEYLALIQKMIWLLK